MKCKGAYINKKRDPILLKIKNLVSVLVSPLVSKKKGQRLNPLTCALDGGRYKIRTCDPIRVKDMLYP